MSTLKYMRTFADSDGGSHIEPGKLELTAKNFVPPAPPIDVSALHGAVSCAFLRVPSGYVGEWHPSPKRQWLFFLSGEMVIVGRALAIGRAKGEVEKDAEGIQLVTSLGQRMAWALEKLHG